jgi:hypothetical protein
MFEDSKLDSDTAMVEETTLTKHVEDTSPTDRTESEDEDIFAENMAYGPDGIRGLIGNSYVFGAAFLASLGGFSFGYDQGVISIINVMEQFGNTFPRTKTAFGTSFMTAMLLLGAFIGCLFMPYLADKISRMWALTVVVVIFDVGAIIQTSAQSYGMLVAGRAIGGIGVGTLAMVYIYLCSKGVFSTLICIWCRKLTRT